MRFTTTDRVNLSNRMLVIGESDARVTGAAYVGSAAVESQDAWSDVDITFGIKTGVALTDVLDEWVRILDAEFGVVHHFDVPGGSAIYRVVLFDNGLELDVSVAPESDFRARGPAFRLVSGNANEAAPSPELRTNDLIGWGWHHLLHANASIERGRPWQAEFWLSGARDHVVALRCIRHGLPHMHGRGVDRLPIEEHADLDATLLASIDEQALRRCLRATAVVFLKELQLRGYARLARMIIEYFVKSA